MEVSAVTPDRTLDWKCSVVNIITWNSPREQGGLGTGLLGQSSSARMASSPPSSGLLWDTGDTMATAAKMAGMRMERRCLIEDLAVP